MLRTRVIPTLLLRRQGLVKTQRFANPVYVGDPINVVRILNDKQVDELVLTEITASRVGASPDFALLEQIASEAFMPVAYGGGVSSVEQAKRLLRLGIEKILLNTATFEQPGLITALAERFGAQCVVASVDVKRNWRGKYQVFSHAGRAVPEPDPVRWIQKLIKLGAGEVTVQAVDREGTMQGFDLALLRTLRGQVEVPLVVSGGAGSLESMEDALKVLPEASLGVGARFIYYGPYRAVLVSYLSPTELERLQSAAKNARAADRSAR
jgi:cyclase